MAPIDVRPQSRLPLSRTFGLCLKGIRHRLFRSVLTTLVIVLAVAFFMNLLADSVVARAVDTGVRAEIRAVRRPSAAIDSWFGHPTAANLAARITAAGAPLAGFAAVAGWPEAELAALAAACRREQALIAWLVAMDSGTRSMLVRRATDDEVLSWLADATRWREFADLAVRVRTPPLPLPLTEVRAAVDAAPATVAALQRLQSAWHGRVDALGRDLATLCGGADADACTAWLVAGGDDRTAAVHAALTKHGFAGLWPEAGMRSLQDDFRTMRLRDSVSAVLLSEDGRKRWREKFGTAPSLEERLQRLEDPRAQAVVGAAFTPAQLSEVASAFRHERRLAARELALAGKVDPDGGLISVRQAFLVAISFVVCMVGIANAMLMAITERFREIATMKCLGATDGFILTQFLMESGIQGAFGGAAGMVLGLVLSLLKGGWLYGGHLLWYMPWLGLAVAGALCVLAGLLLATLASVYPSWKASRMAPMEAMRVE